MAQFLGDIAYSLESILLILGLVIMHVAIDKKSRLLKFTGSLAIILSMIGLICTSYYWLSYQSQGAFEKAKVSIVEQY